MTGIVEMVQREKLRISFPVEVRTTAPDDVALSTSYGRESAYIAVHMYKGMEFDAYFRGVAEIMARYRGRPHWGKMHFLGCDELSELYPQWQDFQVVRRQLDPDGTFENDYVKRVFGPTR
jgi:L-gulonolactone oxidase